MSLAAQFRQLFLGELRRLFRGTAGLMLTVLTPALGVPLIVLGGAAYGTVLDRPAASARDAATGEDGWMDPDAVRRRQELADDRPLRTVIVPDEVAAVLQPEDRLERVLDEGQTLGEPGAPGEVDAIARWGDEGELVVAYRFDIPDSRAAAQRLRSVAPRASRARVQRHLVVAGVPPDEAGGLVIANEDHAGDGEQAGARAGGLLPMSLLLMLIISTLYTAAEVVTGEREKKTVETLLVTRLDRRAIVASKFALVVAVGIAAVAVGLLSLQLLPWLLPDRSENAGLEALTGARMLGVFAIGVTFALQLSAAAMVVAAWSPSYRTLSMLSMPLVLLFMVPAGLPMADGVTLNPLIAVLPVAGGAVAMRDLLLGTATPAMLLLMGAAAAVHATWMMVLARSLFGREDVLLGTLGVRKRDDRTREAALVGGLGMLLPWFFGQLAQAADLVWGLVFTQVVLIAGLALVSLWFFHRPVSTTWRLRWPSRRDALLAVLAGLCLPAVGSLVAAVQDPWLPTASGWAEQFQADLLGDRSLMLNVLLIAVLPGVCEELLFRGTLLGLTERGPSDRVRVALVAALFGIFHLTAPRILPTATLGLLLGFAMLRTRSIAVPMAMHTLNNALAVVLASSAIEGLPGWLLVLGSVAAFTAVVQMGRSPQG